MRGTTDTNIGELGSDLIIVALIFTNGTGDSPESAPDHFHDSVVGRTAGSVRVVCGKSEFGIGFKRNLR